MPQKGEHLAKEAKQKMRLARKGIFKYDWADLPFLYLEKQLSIPDIASIKKCSWTGVRHALKRQGIPRRTLIEARSLIKHKYTGLIGEHNPNWRGGRIKSSNGYVLIRLYPEDFFYSMCSEAGYILEHRLVVAKALGRCLHRWEIVHHKGTKYPKGSIENKQDNRYPQNLQLVTDERHNQLTILENKIDKLKLQNDALLQGMNQVRHQNDALLQQIKLLRWQIKQKEETKW